MHVASGLLIKLLLTLGVAFVICLAVTPLVKRFAEKIGAIDIPGDLRRIHDRPIPRMGGLAIFLGFLLSVLIFSDISLQIRGILLGCIIIVLTGAVDDVISLNAWVKLGMQIAAAVVVILHGVSIEVLTNPIIFSSVEHLILGILSVPVTIIWIVAVTNSVNLIDGLDGLAAGISTIGAVVLLIVAILDGEYDSAVLLAALAGSCLGFIPYNLNPAKIFMGDTGSLLLGFVLAAVSIFGLFKFYTIITFIVPVLALAVPMADTVFAFFRRLFRGKNPMSPDREHIHHRLLNLGFSQRQAVAVLYAVSAVLGACGVLLATTGELKVLFLVVAILLAAAVWLKLTGLRHDKANKNNNDKSESSRKDD